MDALGLCPYNLSLDMLAGFFLPFVSIGLAEFGDKTQIVLLLLSSRTQKHLSLLLGAILGFMLVDGVAVFFGSCVAHFIPQHILKFVTAFLFFLIGVLLILDKRKEEGEEDIALKNPFLTAFLLIFLTEWGDKTQLLAALFATRYHTFLVLLSVLSVLSLLSFIAIYLGRLLSSKIDRSLLTRISGGIFVLLALFIFFS